MNLQHGGQLPTVAQQFNIPIDQWLDLSTGISPFSYPINRVPERYYRDLPHFCPSLINAAKQYYQAENVLPCHGSQAVIERLPIIWRQHNKINNTVYLPKVGYKEHQKSWLDAGYSPQYYDDELPQVLKSFSVVIVINPNNPNGQFYQQQELLSLYQQVKSVQGLLVVDEAFIDVMPQGHSLIPTINDDHLMVLRSFGKFFGLAGLRIGFAFAATKWLNKLSAMLGPWQVNGPAQFIAQQALNDEQWQTAQLDKLTVASNQLTSLLKQYFPAKISSCPLFITVYLDDANEVYQRLCQQGVYVRLTDEKDSLRFGIPNEEGLMKLEEVLLSSFKED